MAGDPHSRARLRRLGDIEVGGEGVELHLLFVRSSDSRGVGGGGGKRGAPLLLLPAGRRAPETDGEGRGGKAREGGGPCGGRGAEVGSGKKEVGAAGEAADLHCC